MKQILVILLALSMSFSLAACKGKETSQDEEAGAIGYSSEEIGLESFSGNEGIFILSKEGSYQPVIAFTGYKSGKEASPERYLWFTENQMEILNLVPVVEKGSEVVMVYNSESGIPDSFTLEKYAYKGYTIGAHFYRDVDNSLYIETGGTLLGTYAAESMSNVSDEKEYLVDRVNESKLLPLQNIDNNMEMLLGLEKDMLYNFSFYKGTKYVTFTTKADTQVFQSEKMIELENPYEKTEEGYFVINLPDNLENGYYYICGLGMFEYRKGARQ